MSCVRLKSRLQSRRAAGFTLIEVLVSLVVGTLIVGGVMGVLGASMQYRKRVQDKSADWPILEAAAQKILADPQAYVDTDITLEELPGQPVVKAQWTQVELMPQGPEANDIAGRVLYRVILTYHKSRMHLSLIRGAENES